MTRASKSEPQPATVTATVAQVAAPRLICFAVREEGRFFQADEACRILVHGMGPRNARAAFVQALASLQSRPALVLTCGFAGGLNPKLEVGSVLYDLDDGSSGTEEFSRRLEALRVQRARFHGAERVAVTAREKQELRRSTGADAVEMESSVIRALCRDRQLPSLTLRVISDRADEDLPLDFNRLMTASGGLHWGRFVIDLLKEPRRIPKLLQLQRNSALAARQLGQVLQGLLSQTN